MEEQERKENRKALLLMIFGVLVLVLLSAGATYAYFQAQAGDGAKANIDATTGTTNNITFSIEEGKDQNTTIDIKATQENFREKGEDLTDDVNATATIRANNVTNKASMEYNVYLRIEKNNFEYTQEGEIPELYLTITKNGSPYIEDIDSLKKISLGDEIDSYDITTKGGLIKIAEKEKIEATSASPNTDTWNIQITYKNLEANQNGNANKTFKGEIIIQKEKKEPTLGDICLNQEMTSCFKENYKIDKAIKNHDENLIDGAQDNSYRYTGGNEIVNNYVCLDEGQSINECEEENLYRIIGLFKNQEEYEIKVIKNSTIGEKAWDSKGENNWENSTLKEELNNEEKEFYTSLSDNAKSLLISHDWQVSGNSYTNITEQTVYDTYNNEIIEPYKGETFPDLAEKVSAKIGLIYASEISYI